MYKQIGIKYAEKYKTFSNQEGKINNNIHINQNFYKKIEIYLHLYLKGVAKYFLNNKK